MKGINALLIHRSIKTVSTIVFTLLTMLSFHSSAADVISVRDIKLAMAEIDEATNNRNAKKLLSFLSDDAVIIGHLPSKLGETVTLSKKEYLKALRESWSLPVQFTYYARGLKVKRSSDGKSAIATQTILETVISQGRLIASASTKETSEFVLEDGELKVRRVEGITTLK